MKRLTKSEFRKWLKAHAPDDVVGFVAGVACCPVARYLGEGASVGVYRYAVAPHEEMRALPPWAMKFVRTIDGPRSSIGSAFQPVTASEALAALEGE